jgi:hypothetical protein
MKRKASEEVPILLNALKSTLGADRRVFVCCHADVEVHFAGLDHGFTDLGVGHWHAIDGRNDWRDFDTAVIFGLPYRDKIWSANTFMALKGLQNNAWLNNEGDRPFKHYRDIRKSLEIGRLIVEIVQAINRVRSRRVVDHLGNCDPVDVFLMLPHDETGRGIEAGIEVEMPGIKVIDWEYAKHSTVKRRVRRSNFAEALVAFAKAMPDGRQSASDVRNFLKMSRETWMRLAADLRDAGSELAKKLADYGVRYEASPRSASYLVKG